MFDYRRTRTPLTGQDRPARRPPGRLRRRSQEGATPGLCVRS